MTYLKRANNAIAEIINETMVQYGLDCEVKSSDAVIAAFSGGADSSLMLHYLIKYCEDSGVYLCAAHVNHMIRGDEALRDEMFCRAECENLGIELFTEIKDVPQMAKMSGRSLEECAREVRYTFFDECVKKLNTRGMKKVLVATAHNADDSVETVLFNLVRGTGTKGLFGIAPLRDGKYIRPLIALTSEQIREYCAEYGIKYVYDSTNADRDYTRNYIRHEIVPRLEKINPSLRQSLRRTGEVLSADDEFLTEAATEALGEYKSKTYAPRKLLAGLHDALLSRAITMLYRNLTGNTPGFIHIKDGIRLIKRGGTGSLDFPDKTIMLLSESVSFIRRDAFNKKDNKRFYIDLENGGGCYPEYGFDIMLFESEDDLRAQIKCADVPDYENIYKLSIFKALRFDKINGKLFARNRENGDVFLFGGMHHRLKKLLNEAKMPLYERDKLPIICDDNGILWIPGFPVRDGFEAKAEIARNENKRIYLLCRLYKGSVKLT